MPTATFFHLSEERRSLIEVAARAEFSAYPFQESNVNRIIKAAGIASGSFYQYFEDKKDLFFYLLESELILMEQDIGDRRLQAMYRDNQTLAANRRLMDEEMGPEGLQLIQMLSLAPEWVRREWVFSVLIPRHRDSLYTLASPPPEAANNPLLAKYSDLFVAFFLGITVLLGTYASENDEALTDYGILSSIFWAGVSRLSLEECVLPECATNADADDGAPTVIG